MKNIFRGIVLLLVLNSFLGANVVPYKSSKTKANAKLIKNTLVCRTKRSLNYLLKSEKNYQKVVDGLASNSIYKDCFYSTVTVGVTVFGHYNIKNLIKNYYVINEHTDNTRYVPTESRKQSHKAKKSKRKYTKKRKKKRTKKSKSSYKKVKKSRKVKKYTKKKKYNKKSKPKVVYKTKKVPSVVKNSNVYIAPTETVSSVDNEEVVNENQLKSVLSTYSEPRKEVASHEVVTQKETLDYMKVYRCSAVSFDESFRGEHVEQAKSKKMALDNCKKYQKDDGICIFENCFILRVDID